ncbi:hypothetical protein AVEN_487-1 [Araneus ventricosus]|uniref:Uncharacterized protein n=1 Tax=Araneus ventricosus TaxID=182803 RepID=A0A4Y2LKC8_ARAVE|nr:hypothetical protein AVEN_487-1 [Araneus ventricosus]
MESGGGQVTVYDISRRHKLSYEIKIVEIGAVVKFNSNFTCGDPTILPYKLIHSRNRETDADATGISCTVRDTALRTPLSSCDKFVKHDPLLSEEIG